MHSLRPFLVASAVALSATASAQTILIDDDFEIDTSLDYTIVDDGSPDGSQAFAFDYVAAGIPLAPRSAPGDAAGLRLTANDTVGSTDAWTLFHDTSVTAQRYRLTVDVWMNFDALSGSTEFGHVGVGGDGVTFNSVFTPISGSGAFISFTGDGGSISDYRWFRDPANTPMGDPGSTTLPNSHESYLNHGSNNTGAFFQTLFPSPPSTVAGSPGNIWTTVEVEVDNGAGVISFKFDDALTFRGDFAGSLHGQISLGLVDVFTSVSGTSNLFTLFDNLIVESLPDPLGSNYCSAVPNSTGNIAVMSASGGPAAAANDIVLMADLVPQNATGFFITSQTQGNVMQPGGSDGVLCLGGAIGRYVGVGEIQDSGVTGAFDLELDLNQTPTPTGLVAVTAGQTWNFQAWHRDSSGGTATSNFTDALSITFQ